MTDVPDKAEEAAANVLRDRHIVSLENIRAALQAAWPHMSDAVCDSYAEENQKFSDEIELLKRQLDDATRAIARCAKDADDLRLFNRALEKALVTDNERLRASGTFADGIDASLQKIELFIVRKKIEGEVQHLINQIRALTGSHCSISSGTPKQADRQL